MTTAIEFHPPAARHKTFVNGLGMLRRALGAFLDAMERSRQRQAEREIARYAALYGDLMTDDLELEINRRL